MAAAFRWSFSSGARFSTDQPTRSIEIYIQWCVVSVACKHNLSPCACRGRWFAYTITQAILLAHHSSFGVAKRGKIVLFAYLFLFCCCWYVSREVRDCVVLCLGWKRCFPHGAGRIKIIHSSSILWTTGRQNTSWRMKSFAETSADKVSQLSTETAAVPGRSYSNFKLDNLLLRVKIRRNYTIKSTFNENPNLIRLKQRVES